jgi:hypothetical protein
VLRLLGPIAPPAKSKAPKEITDELENTYKFKLKGTGPIEFHLGCDFYCDEDGTLCFGPKKYIEKMVDAYMRMFGSKPTSRSLPHLKRTTIQNLMTRNYSMTTVLPNSNQSLDSANGPYPWEGLISLQPS